MEELKLELPELPPLNPAPSMSLDQFMEGEQAVSVMACLNFAKLYAEQYGEACYRKGREDAAKIAESMMHAPPLGREERGENLMIEDVVAAIRKGSSE